MLKSRATAEFQNYESADVFLHQRYTTRILFRQWLSCLEIGDRTQAMAIAI